MPRAAQWALMNPPITYFVNRAITAAQFRELLNASTLGERRPVDDAGRLEAML